MLHPRSGVGMQTRPRVPRGATPQEGLGGAGEWPARNAPPLVKGFRRSATLAPLAPLAVGGSVAPMYVGAVQPAGPAQPNPCGPERGTSGPRLATLLAGARKALPALPALCRRQRGPAPPRPARRPAPLGPLMKSKPRSKVSRGLLRHGEINTGTRSASGAEECCVLQGGGGALQKMAVYIVSPYFRPEARNVFVVEKVKY